MRRGYLTPLVMIILALITLGVAITLFLNADLLENIKNQPTPSPQSVSQTPPSPPSDETANWKIYKNQKYALKYPEGWIFREIADPENFYIKIEYRTPPNADPAVRPGDFLIRISSISSNLSSKKYYDKTRTELLETYKKYPMYGIKNEEAGTLTVDGRLATFWNYTSSGSEGSTYNWNIYVANSGNISVLEASTPTSGNGKELVNIFNQILSTFKFLD